MAKDKKGKIKLSKSVLEMKFMQRSKLKAIAEQEAEEGEAMYGKNITAEMKNVVDKYIVEPSYVPIKKLIVGRVSYRGMNPEVEKLMKHKTTGKKSMEISRQMDKDISDLEMATHFKSNLANTMGKKFVGAKVSKRQLKKMKFQKPNE